MKELASKLAAKRQTMIEEAVHALDMTPTALSQLEEELAAVDALQARLKPVKPVWPVPLGLATLAIALIALASIIRLGFADIEMETQVTQIEIQTGPAESMAPLVSETFPVDRFELIGLAHSSPVARIASMTLLPDSHLELSIDSQRCMKFIPKRASSSAASGGLMLSTMAPPDAEGIAEPSQVVATPGTALRFCLPLDAGFTLIALPTSLEISQLQSAGPPEVRISTITSGFIRFNQTGRRQDLGRLDKLRFSDIKKGTLVVSAEQNLNVSFSGHVVKPESIQSGLGNSIDMRPSLLDFIANSPIIRSLFGLVTGLVGLLWAGLNYFSGQQRR